MRLLVTANEGTSQLVADECSALDLRVGKVRWDGVELTGGFANVAKLLVWLRVGERVLVHLHTFDCRDARDLYEGTREAKWLEWVDSSATVGVVATGKLPGDRKSPHALRTHVFAAQKVKDALVDELRGAFGHRPDIELRDPDVQVIVRFFGNRCSLFLDASGAPLHRRGYRFTGVEAPVSETLAAAILADTGFARGDRLVDPMCGSGTIAIEAAMIHAGLAPGAERAFGIERWPVRRREVRKALDRVRKDARARRRALKRPKDRPILASDIDPQAVAATRQNARTAGVEGLMRIVEADARELKAPAARTHITTNVPWGERIGEELEALYGDMGKRVASFDGCRLAVLSGHEGFVDAFGLRPDRTTELRNGRLDVRLHHYDIGANDRDANDRDANDRDANDRDESAEQTASS